MGRGSWVTGHMGHGSHGSWFTWVLGQFTDCYLEQHVGIPTGGNNVLDLILTNEMPIKDGIRMLSSMIILIITF